MYAARSGLSGVGREGAGEEDNEDAESGEDEEGNGPDEANQQGLEQEDGMDESAAADGRQDAGGCGDLSESGSTRVDADNSNSGSLLGNDAGASIDPVNRSGSSGSQPSSMEGADVPAQQGAGQQVVLSPLKPEWS